MPLSERERAERRKGRLVGLFLLAGLLVVNVGAAAILRDGQFFRSGDDEPVASSKPLASVTPLASPTPTASPTSTATETPVASATPEASGSAVAGRELPLAVLSEDRALRAVPGSCDGLAGRVERSKDGGRSWDLLNVPAQSVLRLHYDDRANFWIVGADADCDPEFHRTIDGGRSFSTSTSTSGAWHLLPDPKSTDVHAPGGVAPVSCASDVPPVEVEGVTGHVAFVLCADGQLLRTQDKGASWTAMSRLPGGVALAVAGDENPLVAVTGSSACVGLEIRPGSGDSEPVGCIETDQRVSAVAFAMAGDVGMIVFGGNVWATGNGGHDWNAVQP